MAATPPLQTAVHTPPTPLHGARYDSYQPYSNRKSMRQLAQREERVKQTPPPHSSDSDFQHALKSTSKPRSIRQRVGLTFSPPSSPHNSPQKKLFGDGTPKKHINSSAASNMPLPTESASLDPFQESNDTLALDQSATKSGAYMLPTPAKTPRKKPVPSTAIVSAARVLFPAQPETVEDAMPLTRKSGRKRRHVGFSLDNSMEDDNESVEARIQIFTDSKEKVPELDPSEDNPFYENPEHVEPLMQASKARSSRKRKTSGKANTDKETEAFNRGEGMVYVFRGKKIFRKFAEEDSEPESSASLFPNLNNVNEPTTESSIRLRPFTRSSIKPRLLFPSAAQRQERALANTDEEAVTDIEDPPPLPIDSEMIDPAVDTEPLVTPVKENFSTPHTPPATGHATRATTRKARLDSSSPAGPEPTETSRPVENKQGKKVSPFDGWQRTKPSTTGPTGKGKKRAGDLLDKAVGAKGSKRLRGTGL